MGYSTCGMHGPSRRGPKCCDRCDKCPRCDGVIVTARRCPAGWCGPDLLCAACYAAVKQSGQWSAQHANCATYAAESAAGINPFTARFGDFAGLVAASEHGGPHD